MKARKIMETKDLVERAKELLGDATVLWGDTSRDSAGFVAAQLAQATATIAIAQELARLNEQLGSVIRVSKGGNTKWIETYDNSPKTTEY
jgi:hypothetical protein